MKSTAACPKCKGRRLWVIEPFHVPTEARTEMRVVLDQAPPNPPLLRRLNPQGLVDLYICAGCGFSEFWARDIAGLQHRPEQGVRLWDNTDPNQGPFR